MSIRSFLSLACFGMVAACAANGSSVSPRQECEDTASALCERIYGCYTPAELVAAGLPSSEAACVTSLQANRGCSAQTEQNVCTGNQTYNSVEAAKCSDQITGLTCGQVRDPFFDETTAAPACALICAVSP